MAVIEPQKKEFLYEQIADKLEADILNGVFEGDKLPSEQVLCALYSASRAVIREALKILSERRLVYCVVGSGAYITKPDVDDLTRVLYRLINTHNITLEDAIAVRINLETDAIALAATRATAEEIEQMDILRDKLKQEVDPQERVNLDFMFHAMICKASHNTLLSIMSEAMGAVIKTIIQNNIILGASNPEAVRHISHGRILAALKSHDVEAARCVLYDHLYTSKILLDEIGMENPLLAAKNGKEQA